MTRGRQASPQQVLEEMAVEAQSLLHDVGLLHEQHLHHDKWEIHTERQISMNEQGAISAVHQENYEDAVALLEQNHALFAEWFKRDAAENRRHREALDVLDRMAPMLRDLSAAISGLNETLPTTPSGLRAVGS